LCPGYAKRPSATSGLRAVLPMGIAPLATSWVVVQQAAAGVLPGGVRFWAGQASGGRLAGTVWCGVVVSPGRVEWWAPAARRLPCPVRAACRVVRHGPRHPPVAEGEGSCGISGSVSWGSAGRARTAVGGGDGLRRRAPARPRPGRRARCRTGTSARTWARSAFAPPARPAPVPAPVLVAAAVGEVTDLGERGRRNGCSERGRFRILP
jgi:hypothetical protein